MEKILIKIVPEIVASTTCLVGPSISTLNIAFGSDSTTFPLH